MKKIRINGFNPKEMGLSKIKARIKLDGTGKLYLGKKDISNQITDLSIRIKAGELPKIKLTIIGDLDMIVEGKLKIEKKKLRNVHWDKERADKILENLK